MINLSIRGKKAIWGYIFITPWIIRFLGLEVGPLLSSFYYSFCEYNILSPPKWIGIGNYVRIFTEDPLFIKSLYNTFYYTGFVVSLGIVFGFSLASVLNAKTRGITWYRVFCYLPSVIPPVAGAVLWVGVFNPRFGALSVILRFFHISPPLWLNSEVWSKPALILMSLWHVGGTMIIYLAGLQGVPRRLYEAAELDGAGKIQRFVKITIPLMTPIIFFNLIMGIINSFQVFTQAFIMTKGGPLNSTLFYVLYLYRYAFEFFQMGYASALGWILFGIVMALTILFFKSTKYWVYQ